MRPAPGANGAAVTPGADVPAASGVRRVGFTNACAAGVLCSSRGFQEPKIPCRRIDPPIEAPPPPTHTPPPAATAADRLRRFRAVAALRRPRLRFRGGVRAGAGDAAPCVPTRRQGIFGS
jgi:hypothetical protein